MIDTILKEETITYLGEGVGNRPLVFFYNPTFGVPIAKKFYTYPGDYALTVDKRYMNSADYVVVRIPELWGFREKTKLFYHLLKHRYGNRSSKQKWVARSTESEENYPLLKNRFFMSLFDIVISYKQDSTIWAPYIDAKIIKEMYQIEPLPKTKSALAAMFISSNTDKSGREKLLVELMHHIKIDSFGKFKRNKTIPNDNPNQREKIKLETIASYKFTIAFENSIVPDYVTEKFFDPLRVGSVPIYLGAPNIDEYAPSPKSFINVNDYDSVKELADYLQFLSENESAYNEYLAWKKEEISNRLLLKAKQFERSAVYRFCEMICAREKQS